MVSITDGMRGRGTLLPRPGLARSLIAFIGFVFLVCTFLLAALLATYNHNDPSWNHAIDAMPTNLLGKSGANLADLLVQVFGAAGLLLPIVSLDWSVRLLAGRWLERFWLRILLTPSILGAAALALAIVPPPARWPQHVGFGGVIGGVARHFLDPFGAAAPVSAMAAAVLAGLILLYVSGFVSEYADDEEDDEPVRHTAPRPIGQEKKARAPRFAGVTAGLFGWLRRPADDRPERRRGRVERERIEPVIGDAEPERNFEREREPALVVDGTRPARKTPHKPADVAKPRPAIKQSESSRQTSLDLGTDAYELPSLELLTEPPPQRATTINEEALQQNARLLESVLEDFGIRGEIRKVRPGPVVTLYELEPAPGIKASRIIGLADDIARSMSAISARVAVIPGRNVIGIELPNAKAETVYLRELLASEAYERSNARLALILGKDIGGAPVTADLAHMPHLLIAGTTGSGKSVGINTMILSLLYRLPPDKCRFIMIDPKMLELSMYDGIPHLLCPVVTDPKKAVVALKWTVREMESRYRAMTKLGVRNLDGYNQRLKEARAKGVVLTHRVQTGFDPDTGGPRFEEEPIPTDPLPLIVVVVDEMADLMLVAGKDIEAAVQRLAQMARAAGIHIMMATQRPSVDVITGTIKANLPTRISFQVTSKIDSRTILGEAGAEQLLGRGDMLYMAGGGRITRVHGPFVSDKEVETVVRFLKENGPPPSYIDDITEDDDADMNAMALAGGEDGGSGDLYDQAVALVCRERRATTSYLQRRFEIGYNKAARLIERMEKEGVISAPNHVGKREVLAQDIPD
ncbi:MAG TPA: DNA translocase FtsK 4TM domain-containing protein [Stellaceae bacterium]|jgi:S-DNA-T family DNA segregation ATPase FtsK/SpoIIIE